MGSRTVSKSYVRYQNSEWIEVSIWNSRRVEGRYMDNTKGLNVAEGE